MRMVSRMRMRLFSSSPVGLLTGIVFVCFFGFVCSFGLVVRRLGRGGGFW